MAKEVSGLSVDLELKALLVVSVYALLKLLGQHSQNTIFIFTMRGFFIVGHLMFFYFYILANGRITKVQGRPNEEKVKAKKTCQVAFRNIMIRALVIGLVHYRTNMIPPLIISVFMAFYTLIENVDYYYVIHSKFPKIFEIFF